ncbi:MULTISPECIES: DNA polymerase/3'-5' exonuclease PolX [Bacillus]|uniref:DNA polymerase/3'-5' exonuclease PolX n=1 Tax=Bacillus TaxID=1386 RepID=UPI0022E292A0|nr:DNA polymerase/3'-5' exonuclease PolX [Bacillus smithii]
MINNKKSVVRLLENIAIHMELKGENSFKVSAFRKAAAALEKDERGLNEIKDFTSIPGIGKATSSVIEEFIETGTSSVLEQLQQEVPKGLIPLLQIPGLGGKKISKLYQELGITNAEELKAACEKGEVQNLPGFGKKTEEKILAAIKQVGDRPERLPIWHMLELCEHIEKNLANIDGILQFARAGSIRRLREMVKDLDFIIAAADPQKVADALIHLPGIKEVTAAGKTKVSVVLEDSYGVSVDFRIVEPEQFATALHHFTGSKDHNVRMRQLAKQRGERISEYGIENKETGEIVTFSTEEDFYRHFGLPWIPPEIREDGTEVDHYRESLDLVRMEDLKGDMHMHTTWSDGAYSLEEMVEACRKKGYQYMAITDHSQYLKVANGLTPDRLKRQIEEIKKLNEKYSDIEIFSGIEMDILPDGTLDFDDELLSQLDFVIASIHSHFSQSRSTIMKRLRTALENPYVRLIAHPTGRLIGRRQGYDVDIDLLIEWAKETNTALELNANPHRLDLSADHLRKAQEAGVKFFINTDAHAVDQLRFMEIGVKAARKGWIKRKNILNTLDAKQMKRFLQIP